jgi:hypothetical protein
MRNECSIVRDILPLYIEDMVSDDTSSFVKEHLENCSECREKLEKLKSSEEIELVSKDTMLTQENAAAPLKTLKRKLRHKQIISMLLSFIVAAVFIGSAVFVLFSWGIPAGSENIKLEPEIQYSETGYLNQEFALHITQMYDKPLGVSVKNVYQTDENGRYIYDEYGHTILVGYEIAVREIPFGNDPNNFTMGYKYDDETAPSDDYDFTFTIKFKDTVVVYSMAEEGLFIPQSDISQ